MTHETTAKATVCSQALVSEMRRHGLEPDAISATGEGGVIVELHQGGRYHMFECHDEGELAYYYEDETGKATIEDIESSFAERPYAMNLRELVRRMQGAKP